jgi:hypothetical protein
MTWFRTGNNIAPTDFLGTLNEQPLVIKTNQAADNSEKVRVNPDGNVGIGKAPASGTPYKLDVAGTINATDIHKNGAPLPVSQWTDAPGGITYGGGSVGIDKAPSTTYKLDVAGSINAVDVHKDGAPLVGSQWEEASGGISYGGGNVGIGGSIWESSLSVTEFGQGPSTLLFLRRDESQEAEGEFLSPAQNVHFILDPTNRVFNLDVGGQYNSQARIHLGDLANPDNPVTTLGRVGIGTTDPGSQGAKLHIVGPAPSDANGAQLRITESNGKFMLVGRTLSYGFVQSHNREPLALNPLGNNVGIGTTQPGAKLDVAGNLNITGSATKPGGGSWSSTSDIRLKKSVQSLKGALEQLLQLRGVSFEWKDPQQQGTLTGEQMGLVAQEVEEVFPQWISTDPDGYKNMTVRGFEALAVEAFKQLKAEFKAENEKLRARIEALELA